MSYLFKTSDAELVELFYQSKSRQDVARLLEISDKSLRYFLYVKRPENLYTHFTIAKRSGQSRNIFAPEERLKNIQKKLTYVLNLIYEPKICTHGFVKKKSIISNAVGHTRKKLLFNFDLKDFFTQIHFGRVRGLFVSPPYNLSVEAATVLAQIACYKGFLPQGAPSSPIITNMICKPLDNQLMRLSKKHKLVYSRYADDITFSTFAHEFPKGIINGDIDDLQVGKELKAILGKNTFVVNQNKVFLNSNRNRQEVTGLIVNKFLNVKRQYVKEIRAILHHCRVDGIYQTALQFIAKGFCKNPKIIAKANDEACCDQIVFWFKNVLKGKICFIRQVKGATSFTFLKFAKDLNDLFRESVFDQATLNVFTNKVKNNVFVIKLDDGKIYRQGSGFFLKEYGFLTNFHVTEVDGFFSVYKYDQFDDHRAFFIGNDINLIKSEQNIDYALYKVSTDDECFEIGDSTTLETGDQVTIVGYPKFQKGDSPYIQTCNITSRTNYMGSVLFTVSGRVVHGASGGIVLNNQGAAIGLLKGGVDSYEKEADSDKQGFVPLHVILRELDGAQ